MAAGQSREGLPSLLWVYAEPIASSLDSATWLESTRELRRLGWTVTLVAMGSKGRCTLDGVEVELLPRPALYLLGMSLFHLAALRFIMQRWKTTNLVLFHQMSAPWLLPLRLWRGLRRSGPLLVMDTRDLAAAGPTLRNRLRRGYLALVQRLANHLADGQTAITPRMAELAGIPSTQLWGIWPSGVIVERFAAARVGRRWPAPAGPIRLIYIGKLRPKCHLMELCRAVEEANLQGMAFALTLVGEGPERPGLAAFAEQTDGRILVKPPVAHAQIPGLLRDAHVGVTALPEPNDRLFAASSPLKLFEYMAAGLPILATANVCHTEVVSDRRFAFWATDEAEESLLAALRQAWSARDELECLGSAAARAAEAWTWQEAAGKLSEALLRGQKSAQGSRQFSWQRRPGSDEHEGARSDRLFQRGDEA